MFNRNVLCLTIATQGLLRKYILTTLFNRNVLCLTIATKPPPLGGLCLSCSTEMCFA